MSGKINVAVQAVAGHEIGTGHFSRAAAVVDALGAYKQVKVTLATNQTAASLVDAYFSNAVDTVFLPDADFTPQAVLNALNDQGSAPDAVYIDQYGLSRAWEEAASTATLPLIVIDDLLEADSADWIIRPIADAVPSPKINVLEGPAYMPLTSDVAGVWSVRDKPLPKAHRINICFGGSDPTCETLKALEAVSTLSGIEVDVIIGPRTRIPAESIEPFQRLAYVRFHHAPTQHQTTKLLSRADIAIGAGGVMQWERLCMGVPSLVVTIADNQNRQVSWMAERGAIRWLGDHRDVTPDLIRGALTALIDDQTARTEMSKTGAALVDGRGTRRIAAVIRAACLSWRPVVLDDTQNLYDWRTHASNWQFNLSEGERPDYGVHIDWLTKRLSDPRCQFMLVTQGQEPVAVVRFDITTDMRRAALSIYLVPQHHGKKLGLAVYFAAERALRKTRPSVVEIVSDIHKRNTASHRLHTDAGFVLSPTEDPNWFFARRRF